MKIAKNSTKVAATRYAVFDSNMHQIVCQLWLCPDPCGGVNSVPPVPLAVFRWPTSKEGEEKEG